MKPSLRFEVFKRDNFTCRYCGKKSPEAILEVDHIHPESKGGLTELENLVTACFECNRGKGAQLLSSVPIESDIHEKAIEIAERERQIEELNYWRAKQRAREDKDIRCLYKYWDDNAYYYRNPSFEPESVRRFLQSFCYEDILALLAQALSRGDLSEPRQWKYFCGICWNKIKEGKGNAED